jgi:hypothetical protein
LPPGWWKTRITDQVPGACLEKIREDFLDSRVPDQGLSDAIQGGNETTQITPLWFF